jgi:hypothetical protein
MVWSLVDRPTTQMRRDEAAERAERVEQKPRDFNDRSVAA